MEINLLKDSLKTLKNVSEGVNEISYEWDIIVPDSKPDIHKILNADAVCTVTDREIMQDRAMITGNVSMNVMYVPVGEEGTLKSIDNLQNFNAVLELEGLRQNMNLSCRAEAVLCEASAINSRKIKIRCKIRIEGSASADEEITYINGVEGDAIEYLVKDIPACRTVSESENRIEINEEFYLPLGKPSAEEIIRVFLKINDRDIRPMNGKVLVKGELSLTMIYNSTNDGDGLQFAEHTVPFTEIFEESDLTDNSVYDGELYLENISCALLPDAEGENRVINVIADIVVSGKGYENVVLSAVVDAYGMDFDIDMEKSDCELQETVNCCESRSVIKETVDFGKVEEINKVINIIGEEYVTSVVPGKNSVTVNGKVNIDMLYNSMESNLPVSYVTKEIPFSITVDCAGADENTMCEVKTDIVSLAYSILNSNQLELRITMDVKIRLKRKMKDRMLSNITVSGEHRANGRDGIVIYFCDSNEKVWDIAKKYRTTVNDIMDANELTSEDEVKRGSKLLIP